MNVLNPRFVYFDTNIISHLAGNKNLWPGLRRFLKENNLIMGICDAQMVELHEAKGLHERIAEIVTSVPSGMMKRRDTILKEEVEAYPNIRQATLSHLPYLLNAIPGNVNGKELLRAFLSGDPVLTELRGQQRSDGEEMKTRLPSLMENFPPSNTGKYMVDQARAFAFNITFQWLIPDHREFAEQFKDDAQSFNAEVILSAQIYALTIFYKYYIGQRKPKRISDFGDLFHLMLIPYCEIAVLERDQCETLKQIKRNHSVLESTRIYNIEFIKEWK